MLTSSIFLRIKKKQNKKDIKIYFQTLFYFIFFFFLLFIVLLINFKLETIEIDFK